MWCRSSILWLFVAALIGCAETESVDRTTGIAPPAPPGASLSEPMMEMAPMMMEESAASSAFSLPRLSPRPEIGIVTAGEIDDALNLSAFNMFVAKARSNTGLPASRLGRPVLAQLVGPQGTPTPGLRVTLRKPGATEPFYDGYAGVDGRVTVFPSLHGAGNLARVELRAFVAGTEVPISTTVSTGGSTHKRLVVPQNAEWEPEFLDLMFVVDTTGSMGDELAFLTREITEIVRRASQGSAGSDIRYGLVVYRDEGDKYTVRPFDFTNSAQTMRKQLREQRAQGGGDYPEAAAAALDAAVNADWRRGQGERILIHVADAPPHDEDASAYLAAAQLAAQRNVQIFGLGASGVADKSEFLMRQAALKTNGRYMFLTDDSGVGLSHAEPTLSCYQVTTLKSLLVRVLRSELSGRRVEATQEDIVRSVGTYRNGFCVN